MNELNKKPVDILLVEDNKGDIILTQEAFGNTKISNNIHVVEDGEEALNFLNKKGEHTNSITPDLILLDLNLPKKDGKQVLEEIKDNDDLRRIPVVIMTSSKSESDITKTYDLHANSYVVKPVSLDKFAEVAQSITNFWFKSATLPNIAY